MERSHEQCKGKVEEIKSRLRSIYAKSVFAGWAYRMKCPSRGFEENLPGRIVFPPKEVMSAKREMHPR